MHDGQTEKPFKGIEVPVPVQQCVTAQKAERRDQAIDCLSDGMPAPAKDSEIPGGRHGNFRSPAVQKFECEKVGQGPAKFGLICNSLKRLAENQVRDGKSLAPSLPVQVIRLLVAVSAEVIHPHGGIDDHHPFLTG